MRFSNYKKYIWLLIFTLILSLCILASFHIKTYTQTTLPHGYVCTADTEGVSFDEISRSKDAVGAQCIFSAHSSMKGLAAVNKSSISFPVKIHLTDENFSAFHSMNIIVGSFLSSEVPKGVTPVVISDALATQLFSSNDIIGNELTVSDISMVIIGVYAKDSSFLYEISAEDIENIYIPYLTKLDNKPKYAQHIFFYQDASKEDINELPDKINQTLNGALAQYKMQNWDENHKVLLQYNSILFFCMGCVLFICLLFSFTKSTKELLLYINNNKKTYVEIDRQSIYHLSWRPIVYFIALAFILIVIIFPLNLHLDNLVQTDSFPLSFSYFREYARVLFHSINTSSLEFTNILVFSTLFYWILILLSCYFLYKWIATCRIIISRK